MYTTKKSICRSKTRIELGLSLKKLIAVVWDTGSHFQPARGPNGAPQSPNNSFAHFASNVHYKKEHRFAIFSLKQCQFHPANGPKLGSWPARTLMALATHFLGLTRVMRNAFTVKTGKTFGE